jgi:hypothetical protein
LQPDCGILFDLIEDDKVLFFDSQGGILLIFVFSDGWRGLNRLLYGGLPVREGGIVFNLLQGGRFCRKGGYAGNFRNNIW